ncbi:S1C family serine protease [Kitasatospora sp. NE20-6]|uniref:S1C family serine protease n=1 Tax=Kitasatospora sp. NE20-6 TaxID=2859066 RepID=UPI0038B25981
MALAGLVATGCTSAAAPQSGASGSASRSASATRSATGSASAGTGAPVAGGVELQNAYQRVIADVLPSVVQITTADGLGSGIVYDTKGDIVTNAHVVGTATTFTVTLANSTKGLDATLVGSYPESDLAVIRLTSVPGGLKPAVFANSSTVEVGQITLAMGSPLGLASSVTQGIVSATGRTVTEPASGSAAGATISNMVQTSAAINPGNSGGALVGLDSKVIGINTLAAVDQELNGGAAPGIGFAIPSVTITSIADQLVKDGKVTDSGRAALDITGRTYFDANFQPAGVAVVSVLPGGSAATAGIQAGDVITALGDTPVTTIASLTTALAQLTPGEQVTVTYTRDGTTRTAQATLDTLKTA